MAVGNTQNRSVPLAYADRFPALREALPGADLPWLGAMRDDAIARFQSLGLPTRRVEDWKYTNLQPLTLLDFADRTDVPRIAEAEIDVLAPRGAPRLVFVNGRLDGQLSTDFSTDSSTNGARVLGLAQALTDAPGLLEGRLGEVAVPNGHAVAALNTAFMADGCLIHLPKGCVLGTPICLVFVGAPGDAPIAYHPRIVVVAEPESEAALVETHIGKGEGAYWSNPVSEIHLSEGARLRHYKIQTEGIRGWHTAFTKVRLEAGSSYRSLVMTADGGVSRNEIDVALLGEGAECRLDGGYMLRGRSHVDNTTRIAHVAPHCASRELYKGVLDDKARGVFQGKIVVHEDAQKSDGHQLSRALLLSRDAEVDTKPELEIYADDVKCSHGATTGELEDDQLFYLRARGIDEAAARGLLVEAFMTELLDEVADADMRERLAALVTGWLRGLARGTGPVA